MDETGTHARELRKQLQSQRHALPLLQRQEADRKIGQAVAMVLCKHYPNALWVGAYWPIRGEPDLRENWLTWGNLALPSVSKADEPLQFFAFEGEDRLIAGRYGIPVPVNTPCVIPDVLVIPCLGYHVDATRQIWRIGYGSGYSDRTLAERRVACIGVAYTALKVTDFHVQIHDQPLDHLVTEDGIL